MNGEVSFSENFGCQSHKTLKRCLWEVQLLPAGGICVLGLLSRSGLLGILGNGTCLWYRSPRISAHPCSELGLEAQCSCVGELLVVWAYMFMYHTCVVFTGIVTQIFLSWMTFYLKHLLGHLIENPKIAHFHWSWSLSLDCVVNNASNGSVIDMYQCWELSMSKFV